MNRVRGSNGITLVALVITIIVLLILAGVTLTLALGNNGILGQASSARVTQIEAEVKEQMGMALMSARLEMMSEITNNASKKFTCSEVIQYVSGALNNSDYEVTTTAAGTDQIGDTSVSFTLKYVGDKYRTAVSNQSAYISRTFSVSGYKLNDNNDTTFNK